MKKISPSFAVFFLCFFRVRERIEALFCFTRSRICLFELLAFKLCVVCVHKQPPPGTCFMCCEWWTKRVHSEARQNGSNEFTPRNIWSHIQAELRPSIGHHFFFRPTEQWRKLNSWLSFFFFYLVSNNVHPNIILMRICDFGKVVKMGTHCITHE